ncbi:MAG: hypothetical protein R6U66_02620 [Bacteroidales bacterium]
MNAPASTIHIRTDRPAFQMQVLAACLIAIGVAAIVTSSGTVPPKIIGSILVLAGVFGLAVHTDLYLKVGTSQLITYWQAFIFRHQTQKILPPIKHVAVVRIHTHRTLNLRSISTFQEGVQYNINLIFEESGKRFKTLLTTEREEALAMGMEIAAALDKPLLDHTSREKHWLSQPKSGG